MGTNQYRWKNYIPLTPGDAKCAYQKGMQVLCLYPTGKNKPVTSVADIRKHAWKGGIFAVNREALMRAETTYLMEYQIVHPVIGPAMSMATPEDGLVLTVEANDRYALFEKGQAYLSQLATQHNCPDGEYWAEYYGYRITLGEKECTDHDKGVVTVKNGQVILVPNNFWLPF